MATLLSYAGAADPLFKSSGTPRLQPDRRSNFNLDFKNTSPAPAQTITGDSISPSRIQLHIRPSTTLPPQPLQTPAGGWTSPGIIELPVAGQGNHVPQPADFPGQPLELPDRILIAPARSRPQLAIEQPVPSELQLPGDPVILGDPPPPETFNDPQAPANAVFPLAPTLFLQEPEPEDPANAILQCRSVSCEETIRQLRPTLISAISLDVTPSYNPNLSEPPARLQTEVRTWIDQQGMAIATGKLADFRFGRVSIQTEQGELKRIPIDQLSDIDRCYVSDSWGFPLDCQLDNSQSGGRDFTPITFSWTASALCHRPTYFEDELLERYGYTAGPWIQPFRSGARFLIDFVIIPYRAGIHPHNECIYTLGFFRPGTPSPAIRPGFPLSVKGGLWQAGVLTGGFYLFP
jgi:hypothetical protein